MCLLLSFPNLSSHPSHLVFCPLFATQLSFRVPEVALRLSSVLNICGPVKRPMPLPTASDYYTFDRSIRPSHVLMGHSILSYSTLFYSILSIALFLFNHFSALYSPVAIVSYRLAEGLAFCCARLRVPHIRTHNKCIASPRRLLAGPICATATRFSSVAVAVAAVLKRIWKCECTDYEYIRNIACYLRRALFIFFVLTSIVDPSIINIHYESVCDAKRRDSQCADDFFLNLQRDKCAASASPYSLLFSFLLSSPLLHHIPFFLPLSHYHNLIRVEDFSNRMRSFHKGREIRSDCIDILLNIDTVVLQGSYFHTVLCRKSFPLPDNKSS